MLRLKAPRDERGEPAGLVLKIPQPQQMLDPLLQRLNGPIHHRGSRSQTTMMCLAHHVDPLVGRRLAMAVKQLPHAIDENLGPSAWNAVEAGRHKSVDY